MKKIVLLSVILIISYSCKNLDTKLVIQEFINAVISDSYDNDKIKKEFIHFYNEYHESKDILFDLQIKEFRSSLKKCNSITIIGYDEAKKQKVAGFFEIIFDEKNDGVENIFFIICDNEVLYPILIKKGRIASFSAMKKGNLGFFLGF